MLLWLLTILVERSNLHGDGWSLAGNGALIVPFLGLPAALIAGMFALSRLVGRPGRWWLAAVAGVALLIGLVLGLAAGFLLYAPS